MAHLHEVRDFDTHYVIDPITMEITNANEAKNKLRLGDHNSEIYTFEIPRVIEGHDMSLCNMVKVHFINISADRANKSADVHTVKDLAPAEDAEDTLVFTWEVSGAATMYAGSLNYRIEFACTDENGKYTYRKWTEVYKGISISDGFDNGVAVEKEYSDILSEWEARLDALEQGGANTGGGVTDYNALTNKPIERIESLDQSNLVNFRDLESGQYILYGYFSPYENSDISISADNSMVSVIKKAAGSHIICLDPLNAKIVFFEILVDETAEKGFQYTRTIIPVLDVNALIAKVGELDELTTDEKNSLVGAINEVANKSGTVTDEQIASAVEDYMAEHPVIPGAAIEPADDDIPKVFFTGVAPATKEQDELPLYMEYRSKTKTIKSYCTLKVQGDSSAKYAKHNFNIKLYADEERTEKQKVVFRDWLKTHKYCMKANWIDHTHARNVVNGRLWNQVVRSRSDIANYPAEYQASPHSGAVDGFPVKVYINGVYQGIYTWNIRKDESMFNMDDETGTHAALIADANSNITIWRALPSIDGTDWTDELNDVVPDAVLTGFRNAYSFVMNSTDEEFKANIEQYFYKSSLIDYYIFIYSILMIGGLAKSQTMFTYDGQKYLANIYDMDTTWALMWNGSGFYDVETACPDDYISQAGLTQNNLLYERVSALFADEIRERYAELRNTVLSNANIINEFERFMDVIPADLYQEDYAETTADGAFTAIPSKTTNTLQKLRDIIVKRMAYVDSKINRVACTGVTISKKELTFTDDTEETLTVTVTPDGCTDTVKWTSDATDVAMVENGVVRPVSAGTATITVTCGEYSDSCVVTVEGVEAAVVADGLLFDLDLTKATAENLTIADNTGNVTATINKAESIAENGGVCIGKGYNQSVNATWVNAPEFGNEYAVEIVSFGFPWCPTLSFGIDAHAQAGYPLGDNLGGLKLKAKYKNVDGESVELPYTSQRGNCSVAVYLDDGTRVTSSVANVPDAHKDKLTHIVVNFNADGTTTVYDSGYPCTESPAAENFASWDMSSVTTGFSAWGGPASTDRILRGMRMYNRTLTKSEVRNNRDFELKKLGY